MKRNFFAGDCNFYIYFINPASVSFKDNDPRIRVFSNKKARDTYAKEKYGACALPARIARYWINIQEWDSECEDPLDDYLHEYPQNDLRNL